MRNLCFILLSALFLSGCGVVDCDCDSQKFRTEVVLEYATAKPRELPKQFDAAIFEKSRLDSIASSINDYNNLLKSKRSLLSDQYFVFNKGALHNYDGMAKYADNKQAPNFADCRLAFPTIELSLAPIGLSDYDVAMLSKIYPMSINKKVYQISEIIFISVGDGLCVGFISHPNQ